MVTYGLLLWIHGWHYIADATQCTGICFVRVYVGRVCSWNSETGHCVIATDPKTYLIEGWRYSNYYSSPAPNISLTRNPGSVGNVQSLRNPWKKFLCHARCRKWGPASTRRCGPSTSRARPIDAGTGVGAYWALGNQPPDRKGIPSGNWSSNSHR